MTHLVVLLESGATPFCQEASREPAAPPAWMPLEMLARIACYADSQQIALSIIYGARPPQEYDALLATIPRVAIVPFALHAAYPEAVLVIDIADLSRAMAELPSSGRQAVVRIAREQLPMLAAQLAAASQCFKRLNTVLLDVEQYRDEDLQCYAEQLTLLTDTLAPRYLRDAAGEISCLTDRPALSAMRNCGAGVAHLTVAPDGRLYLCPAFYQRDADGAVGDFETGPHIANRQLLALDHAPICGRCDAYHCPRCIFLNAQLTGEVNTPSRQQCELAHIERAASARLLQLLHDDDRFRRYNLIPALDYRDPFELIQRDMIWR
jgi:CXXX repeat peptide maturase